MTTSAVSYTGEKVVATPLPSGAEVAVTRSEAVTLAHGGSGKGKGAGSKTAKSSLEAVARSEAADSKGRCFFFGGHEVWQCRGGGARLQSTQHTHTLRRKRIA